MGYLKMEYLKLSENNTPTDLLHAFNTVVIIIGSGIALPLQLYNPADSPLEVLFKAGAGTAASFAAGALYYCTFATSGQEDDDNASIFLENHTFDSPSDRHQFDPNPYAPPRSM